MSSDVYLLGILIGSGYRRARENALDLSRDVLNKFLTLENIDQASMTETCQIQGIFSAKAARYKRPWKFAKEGSQNLIIIGSNDFFSFADEGLL
jgi:DNA repair protein RadC